MNHPLREAACQSTAAGATPVSRSDLRHLLHLGATAALKDLLSRDGVAQMTEFVAARPKLEQLAVEASDEAPRALKSAGLP